MIDLRTIARASLPGLVVLLGLHAGAAHAQRADLARAEALFREGKEKLAAGEIAAACPLLEESFQIDPATGALLALAMCNEQAGKLATAVRQYGEVAERSKAQNRSDREQAAREKVASLTPRVSTISIEAAETRGLRLRLDGKRLDATQLTEPIAVDGGEHVIEASAAGKEPFRTAVMIAESNERRAIAIPALADTRTAAPVRERPRRAPRSSGLSASEWVGISFVGAGVAGLGLGTALALYSAGADEPQDVACDSQSCTYTAPADDYEDEAVMSFVIGGLLATTGAVVYLVSGSSSSEQASARSEPSLRASAWVLPKSAGAGLHGRF